MYRTEFTADEKRIQELETENATLKAVAEHRIKQLEADEKALRMSIMKGIADARAYSEREQVGYIGQRIVDVVNRAIADSNMVGTASSLAETAKPTQPAEPVHPFPNGFTARVLTCSNVDKVLKNVLFYNPGHPFDGGDWAYVLPDTFPDEPNKSPVLRLVYDPMTPEGCVEVGMFQREYFNLKLGASVEFKKAGTIPYLTSCKIRISRFGYKSRKYMEPICESRSHWTEILNGMSCEIGCPLLVHWRDGMIYKVVPEENRPYNVSGVFTKNTQLTIMTEDDIN